MVKEPKEPRRPIESFDCTIEEVGEDEILLRTLSSGGEEAIAALPLNDVPERRRKEGTRFVIDVHAGGENEFRFLSPCESFTRSVSRKVDRSSLRSDFQELVSWLPSLFQGEPDYVLFRLDGLGSPAVRLEFSSESFDYKLIAVRSDGKYGMLSCSAEPAARRAGEPERYETSGDYSESTWRSTMAWISSMETLRTVRLGAMVR